jgi:hypothetical protein
MIIFRTSPETIREVVRLSKHALASQPRLKPGELILISQTVADSRDGKPPIRYVMEFVRIYPDSKGESKKIWGKQWPYIVEGKNCYPLKYPFSMRQYQISNKNYAQGGPYVYVAPADEQVLRQRNLLE